MQPFAADFRSALNVQRPAISQAVLACASAHDQPPATLGAAMPEANLNELLDYLLQAAALNRPALFDDYLAWLNIVAASRNHPPTQLARILECLDIALARHLPPEHQTPAREFLARGLAELPRLPNELPSLLDRRNPFADLTSRYLGALLSYNRQAAGQLIDDALDSGVSVETIYLEVFQRSQYEIGRLWQINQISAGQEHFCSAATQLIMSRLYPRIFNTPRNGLRMVATSVSSNLHEFGIRMIADFFELDGWDTIYLGGNIPLESVIKILLDQPADLVAISATTTLDIPNVIDLIRAIRALGLERPPRLLVGGPPFNAAPDLWQQIQADGFASNAREAVQTARNLIAERRYP